MSEMILTPYHYIALLFGVVALISTLLLVRARQVESARQALPLAAISLVSCWLLALIAPTPFSAAYKGAILFVLTVIVLAGLLYQVGGAPKYLMGALLLVGYTVLLVAIMGSVSLREVTFWVLLPVVLAGTAYATLHSVLNETRSAVIAYIAILGLAGLFAVTFWQQHDSISGATLLASIVLIGVADLLRGHILIAHRFTAMAPYTVLLANLGYVCLAASVWTV